MTRIDITTGLYRLCLLCALAAPAAAQLGEEKSETELKLERARYGGWPTVLIFDEAGLTHADANAPLWQRADVVAALKRWQKVLVNTPKDQPPAAALVKRHQVTEYPTTLLLRWDGTALERWTGRLDGAKLLAALTRHGRSSRPISDREIARRKAYLLRAQKRRASGRISSALSDLRKLVRARPAYGRAVEAKSVWDEIAAEGRAKVAALAELDEKSFEKALRDVKRTYRGVDLKAAIAAVEQTREKAARDARCRKLREQAELALKGEQTDLARAALTKLAAETPHPLATWAAEQLKALDAPEPDETPAPK